MLLFPAISGESSTCEGRPLFSKLYPKPLSHPISFGFMDYLWQSHFRAWWYVHLFVLHLWFANYFYRLHTPTVLYGVLALLSLESYGHIVLGHPQRCRRIVNLP